MVCLQSPRDMESVHEPFTGMNDCKLYRFTGESSICVGFLLPPRAESFAVAICRACMWAVFGR